MPLPNWSHKFELKPGSWVFVPDENCRLIGTQIKDDISNRWRPPSYFAHMSTGGHVEALRKHLGRTLFIRADIDQFFNRINLSRVTRSLSALFSYNDARQMAKNSVVRDPSSAEKRFILPFGFVQSPLIASLCLRHSALGNYLHTLACSPDCTVSVYMDDIIISTDSSENAKDILAQTSERATRSNLELNNTKTAGPAKRIEAFNIELSTGDIRLTDERYAQFETEYLRTADENKRAGIIGYINSVNPHQAARLTA